MKSDLFNVHGKTVIITGSGRGMGLEIAKYFYNMGSNVIRIDKNLTKLQKFKFEDFKIDLTNNNLLEKAVKKIKKKFKNIDVLINNAGITINTKKPYDGKILEKTINTNLYVAYKLSNMICKIMAKKKKGSIINITSLGAELGFKGNPSYQVSKAGLKQLSKALACDWGHKNIRVNNVCPGYMRTLMTDKSFKNSHLKSKRDSRMILKRWGTPNDLVGPCIFLASEASAYITGSDIFVDGGWLAKGL
jgi:NAD(P)-dependent dehydrogenase (short-subunit alcohol dehydrogenase family)